MSAATTSSSRVAADEAGGDGLLGKLRAVTERQRLRNSSLERALDTERSGVRALKAQHEATLRQLRSEAKKKIQELERQLRCARPDRVEAPQPNCAVRKLSAENLSLKAENKSLKEKLKTATDSARDGAAEIRTLAAEFAAREAVLHKDSRAQVHKLLEEIKSKERILAQLKRMVAAEAPIYDKQVLRSSLQCRQAALASLALEAQRMECDTKEIRNLGTDQKRELEENVEELKAEFRHRKHTFYRDCPSGAAASDIDSAVSSAPTSLSPQPNGGDMWACTQCRAANERADERARECSRLSDALRDARDQLELLEFRILELEDAAPDKSGRENLTDSDSGCVSPGSRLQDSASPELRRTDSGCKSPFTGGSVSEQLQQMMCRASSEQDRTCLQQVAALLLDLQAISCDSDGQSHPKRLSDAKHDTKSAVRIATVSPYPRARSTHSGSTHSGSTHSGSQHSGSMESVCDEPRKISPLQESGIFDEIETQDQSTQTPHESWEGSDLNTEIQRLNRIREKLEKRHVARATDEHGLECRCVRLGEKHQQYYERRLKFLEGKIAIYEAAADVKKAKLAERLQHEYVLENRIQDMELEVSVLRERCERLEEECCELDELENDTRLHAQQLETDFELTQAQLLDMTEERECSRAHAERLSRALRERETVLGSRALELTKRLTLLERAVPAIVAFNIWRASCRSEQIIIVNKPYIKKITTASMIPYKEENGRALVACEETENRTKTDLKSLQERIARLIREKSEIEFQAANQQATLEKHIQDLTTQLRDQTCKMQRQRESLDARIEDLERQLSMREEETMCADSATSEQLQSLTQSELALGSRVRELERREAAYLDMLTQADDMWADMEGGYKQRIEEAERELIELKRERERLQSNLSLCKRQMRELEQSECALRVSLDKAERDLAREAEREARQRDNMAALEADLNMAQAAAAQIADKYKKELEVFRQKTCSLAEQLEAEQESSRDTEARLTSDLERARKELVRCSHSAQDLEVTNAELKEEVESLENQLTLLQKGLTQCKRKCDDKIKLISQELSIKTEELEELRSDVMRRSLRPSIYAEMRDCTEYVHEGLPYQSLNFISNDARCSCPAMRSRLVGSLIEDLFERVTHTTDTDLVQLCSQLGGGDSKAQIMEYLMMAISKELVRSIGDADAKVDTVEFRRSAAMATAAEAGNSGVISGAARLASVACACAAARLAAARPDAAAVLNRCQEEVLEHSDVKIMEEQLASAIENILNCPSCALGTNAIVWSTDV